MSDKKERLKLTITEKEFEGLEQFKDLKLDLGNYNGNNGSKERGKRIKQKRHGKNLYKRQLSRLQRTLR